jgi:Mor family transcriptional regulator
MKEIWKPVRGYEEYYEVSNYGNIRSKDRMVWRGKAGFYKMEGKELTKSKTSTGYWKIGLFKDKKRKEFKIHRLVAFAFIDNPENKPNINHIDGNPLNNHVLNLEWCTQSENMKHAYETGLRETNFHKYKNEILLEYITNNNIGINVLCEKYQCSHSSITKFLRSKGVRIRTNREIQNKYKINRVSMINDFEAGLSNKEMAKKYNTNGTLIATYRYKYKKGELII